jgi:large subunit ribosomal protein L34e
MAQRVTLRKRTPYNTKSNRRRVVKTPGGKLRYLHIKKLPTAPKCGDCHVKLPGIEALRPREYANVSKTKKTVSRAYGGSRCSNCVRTRYVRWLSKRKLASALTDVMHVFQDHPRFPRRGGQDCQASCQERRQGEINTSWRSVDQEMDEESPESSKSDNSWLSLVMNFGRKLR